MYFLLVDSGCKPFNSRGDCNVSRFPADIVLGEFKDMVREKYAGNHLRNVAAEDLKVYQNKAALAQRKELIGTSFPLIGLGGNEDEALIVQAPPTVVANVVVPNEPVAGTGTLFILLILIPLLKYSLPL
jgi:hypothetical protein